MFVSQYYFGRIQVDELGITKRSRLLIGADFKINWNELVSWNVAEAFVATLDTGQDESICQLLELHGPAGAEQIDRKAADDKLDALVAYLRLKCPDKETKPPTMI